MKKWKLIVLSAVLSVMVGAQAFAAGVNDTGIDVNQVDEPEDSIEVDAMEWEPDDSTITGTKGGDRILEESSFTTNLPILKIKEDIVYVRIGTVICSDGTEVPIDIDPTVGKNFSTFSGNFTWNLCTKSVLSSNGLPQEEAQKILKTNGKCESIVLDLNLSLQLYNISAEEDLPKEIDGKQIIGFRPTMSGAGDTVEFFWSAFSNILEEGDNDFYNKIFRAVYLPPDGEPYIMTEITPMEDGTVVYGTSFPIEEYVYPVAGGRIAIIKAEPSTDIPLTEKTETDSSTISNGSQESSSSSSSGSHSSSNPAYAQGASVGEIGVKKSGAGVKAKVRKANGEEIDVIVHPYLNPGTKTLTQAQARQMLGTSFACSIYSFDLSIVNAEEDYGPVTLIDGTVPVTFFVPGVTPESKVALRHWINGSSTYEDLPVEVGNGTVKAEFTSFSPVVIVVERPGVAAPADTITSPKTGETPSIYIVEIIALLSLLGFVSCRKKYQL